MKRLVQCLLFVATTVGGLMCLHATADAATPSCSMNQTSLADLISNYDPPVAAAAGTTMTIGGGTLSFTCTGLGSGMASHVYVLVSGSSGSYTTPFLSGPNSFQLSYNLCVPGAASCNASTNVWNTTANANVSAYEVSAVNSPSVNSIPSFQVFVGRQDAFVGTVSQYTGSLVFSFRCGEGGNQVNC